MNTAHLPATSPVAPSVRAKSRRSFNAYAYRLATFLLAFYALGHTLGAVLKTPQLGPASDAVAAIMKSTHVTVQGADCTWYGFYRGFGIIVSIYFVFSAVLTWQLGGMTARERRRLAPVAWALFLSYVAGAVVTWVYFFPAPIVFGTLTAIVLGFAVLRNERNERNESSESNETDGEPSDRIGGPAGASPVA